MTKARFVLALFVLCAFGSTAFAQDKAPDTASAPGCGPDGAKFDVKKYGDKHPAPQPEPGKALDYFFQDDSNFESVPRPTTMAGVDGKWVGATQSSSYFYVSVDPGEHHVCAKWQTIVGLREGHLAAAAHFTAEAGKIYWFRVKNSWWRETERANMKLEPLDSDEGLLLASKFAYCTSREKK
jgi:hypothetical protein